ncbi:DUF305 domain-containing protein [Streptomyces fradiae]|uniref:DUF305 domain-containing protein n=1 Tax=Streptomyces fradiae TaxID=1906 RepID=UPI0035BE8789
MTEPPSLGRRAALLGSLGRRAALLGAAALTALVLSACGGDSGGPETSPPATTGTATAARHNAADVTFAQGMIVHHRQAVMMSEMAESHGASDQVKTLAEKIEKEQEPEIETMSGWLRSWGEEVPEGAGMDGMHHSPMPGMPGMMDGRRMDELRGMSGEAFDTMYLDMMIEHHRGAIEMAETEKREGVFDPAKDLADQIITTQSAEITQMEKLLAAD